MTDEERDKISAELCRILRDRRDSISIARKLMPVEELPAYKYASYATIKADTSWADYLKERP